MEQKDIEKQFANQANQYYAHGIGAYDEKVIKSIFENGLRCSHNELYWTTLEFGKGSETLFKEKEQLMNNWEHKSSKHIMIASLPEVFQLLDVSGTPLFQKKHAAFYNNILPEEAEKLGIAPGLYLKPEFIKGMYDVEKKDFIVNDRYYENLPEEEQRKVFEDVNKQYIDTISRSGWTLAEYAQILEDTGMECPLTSKEISNNGKEIEQQPDMVELSNGIEIPRKQYEQEYTEETRADMVELPNGIKIPRKQYEQEYLTDESKTDIQEQQDFEINEFGEIIRHSRDVSQVQKQQDMVTLPNGVQIPRKQYEEEQGVKKQSKGISVGDVKSSILKGKVTTQETQSATQDMKKLMEIKRLQIMQRTGQTLTPEQKQLLDEHIRQTNEAQVRFRNQQDQKKSKGLSL